MIQYANLMVATTNIKIDKEWDGIGIVGVYTVVVIVVDSASSQRRRLSNGVQQQQHCRTQYNLYKCTFVVGTVVLRDLAPARAIWWGRTRTNKEKDSAQFIVHTRF